MGNYYIETIGKAKYYESKKGNKTLKINFNKGVFKRISEQDFENKIYIMLATGDIICPMPFRKYEL
jgi:hypothetical protein